MEKALYPLWIAVFLLVSDTQPVAYTPELEPLRRRPELLQWLEGAQPVERADAVMFYRRKECSVDDANRVIRCA